MKLSGQYTVGEPVHYTSMYGYPKRKYPISQDNEVIGYVKEERILGNLGEQVDTAYYTRDFERPAGAARFYDNIEALVTAFGGTVGRHMTGLFNQLSARQQEHALGPTHWQTAEPRTATDADVDRNYRTDDSDSDVDASRRARTAARSANEASDQDHVIILLKSIDARLARMEERAAATVETDRLLDTAGDKALGGFEKGIKRAAPAVRKTVKTDKGTYAVVSEKKTKTPDNEVFRLANAIAKKAGRKKPTVAIVRQASKQVHAERVRKDAFVKKMLA